MDTIPHLCYLKHLAKLVDITSDQVQEREPLIILRALVRHFYYLVIALTESSSAQFVPALFVIDHLSRFKSYSNVTTLKGKVETCAFVLNEVECDLRESLLLEVGDDGLPNQVGLTHHLEHVMVSLLNQCVLEQILGGVDGNHAILAFSVEAHDLVAPDSGDVDGSVEGTNDTAVAVREAVLDVIKSGVDKNAVFVPRAALDADGFMHSAQLLEFLVGQDDVLAPQ